MSSSLEFSRIRELRSSSAPGLVWRTRDNSLVATDSPKPWQLRRFPTLTAPAARRSKLRSRVEGTARRRTPARAETWGATRSRRRPRSSFRCVTLRTRASSLVVTCRWAPKVDLKWLLLVSADHSHEIFWLLTLIWDVFFKLNEMRWFFKKINFIFVFLNGLGTVCVCVRLLMRLKTQSIKRPWHKELRGRFVP